MAFGVGADLGLHVKARALDARERLAPAFLALPGVAVEIIDAQVERVLDGGDGLGLVACAAADKGRAHAEDAGLHAGAAQLAPR